MAHVNIVPYTCNLSNLAVFTTDPNATHSDTIIERHQPFSLRAIVEFCGSGAIALMPLKLSVKLNFFATTYGSGLKLDLGSTTVTTVAGVFIYKPTLSVTSATEIGLTSEPIYQLGALLLAGAPDMPALITGFITGLDIQIYTPPCVLDQ